MFFEKTALSGAMKTALELQFLAAQLSDPDYPSAVFACSAFKPWSRSQRDP